MTKSPTIPHILITSNEATVPEESLEPPRDSLSVYGHPAAMRASVVQAAQDIEHGRPVSPLQHRGRVSIDHDGNSSISLAHEQSPKSDKRHAKSLCRPQNVVIDIVEGSSSDFRDNDTPHDVTPGSGIGEAGPDNPRTSDRHGGSHGSMNMHALILHVIGDALGNVGVIATGLIMWLSTWQYKYYFDPVISLIITAIIFSSALPLGWSILHLE